MSILRSTKSGRNSVQLTLTYLTDNHWIFRAASDVGVIDDNFIWKNQHDRLQIIKEATGAYHFEFNHETDSYIYYFTVHTLGDLDIVEQFWSMLKKDKGNALKVLKQNAKNLRVVENPMKGMVDGYTDMMNRKILSSMVKSYRTADTCDRTWQPTKSYFASYFK